MTDLTRFIAEGFGVAMTAPKYHHRVGEQLLLIVQRGPIYSLVAPDDIDCIPVSVSTRKLEDMVQDGEARPYSPLTGWIPSGVRA